MIILSIETSCDETAIAIVEADGGIENPQFKVLGSSIISQANLHAKYGGVFPNLAKREHSKNLLPVLKNVLGEANFLTVVNKKLDVKNKKEAKKILEREAELAEKLIEFSDKYQKPQVDVISVTYGPGLEPALWVGINFAKAMGLIWNIPVIPTNHMEGHIASVLKNNSKVINFPAIALLISGGHTELVLIKDWKDKKILGATRDDAVGEAFDKVARMLELPYPGGPEISRLASEARASKIVNNELRLPRPMINSGDYDFSFSGLKTAVLYYLRDHPDADKGVVAREFEDAVIEILTSKVKKALNENNTKSLIIGGGVIANKELRKSFEKLSKDLGISLFIPDINLATDNAVMIAMAFYINTNGGKNIPKDGNFVAKGNLKIS